MRFAQPEFLWLLAAIPIWVVAGWWVASRRRRALARFAGMPENLPRFVEDVGVNRRVVKAILLLVAYAGLSLALARPQWGSRVETVERRGIDVVLILDTSRSMGVEDVAPDRFRQARLGASELVGSLQGDRVALVAFAGKASLLCPLTVDHEAVSLFLDTVDLETAPIPGTALADALETATEAFGPEATAADDSRGRMIVLYSDGEDHEEGLEDAVRAMRRAGVVLHAVGVGTVEGGPIPETDATGRVIDYKKDRDGLVVTSRLEERVLERLALDTGGRYFRATSSGLEIDALLGAVESLDAGALDAVVRVRYEERYAIPALLALLALAIELCIGDGRGKRIPEEQA